MALRKNEFKVDKSVQPIHYEKRKRFDITVGQTYYVSFGRNIVSPCKVLEVWKEGNSDRVTIRIERGKMATSHYLYADEIGRTPEEAVINTVTS